MQNRHCGPATRRSLLPRTVLGFLCCTLLLPVLCLASTRIAVIGDYGVDDPQEAAVANLIKTNFIPHFIITLGDNNYGTASDFDRMVGKYYHQFIGNYSGTYGTGSISNRFWPALGNHDYLAGSYNGYRNYFTLPGNERYYDVAVGPVHFFMTNSDEHEPDGTGSTSIQALWLSNRLAHSTSPWKIVVVHHPPYSSGGTFPYARWPFRQWGASAVMSGHAHLYERLMIDGLPYLVNGLGGAAIHGSAAPIPGSIVRYNAAHGAMLILADDQTITFEFHSIAGWGTLIDRFTLSKTNRPPMLEPIPDQDVAVGHRWTWTARAVDADVPPQTLRFWLDSGAPTGLSFDSTNGTLSWMPTAQQVPLTNSITLMVADDAPSPATNRVRWKMYAVPAAAPTLCVLRPRDLSVADFACVWPTNYAAGFVLESSDRAGGGSWAALSAPVVRSNGLCSVVLQATNTARYLRLRK